MRVCEDCQDEEENIIRRIDGRGCSRQICSGEVAVA